MTQEFMDFLHIHRRGFGSLAGICLAILFCSVLSLLRYFVKRLSDSNWQRLIGGTCPGRLGQQQKSLFCCPSSLTGSIVVLGFA